MNVGRLFKRAQEDMREVRGAPLTDDQEAEWLRAKAVPVRLDMVPTGTPVQAYVNHSRWVADCPDDNSAMWLREMQPGFMCGECFNVANGNRARPVVWPAEDVKPPLDVRPDPRSRNWKPPETVADLLAENDARNL